MEDEAAKGYRVVLLAVMAVEFFKALVAVLEAVEFFKALVVVLVAVAAVLGAVVAEATTVQGVVNKPIMHSAHVSFWR